MIVLAVGSAFLGLILGPTGWIIDWLTPVVGAPAARGAGAARAGHRRQRRCCSSPSASLLAWWRYLREAVPQTAPVGSLATRAARRDLFQDDVNEAVLMRPGQHLTRSLVFVDNKGVDGAVGGFAALIGGTSARLRRWQNGFVRSYALSMLAGVVVVLAALAVIR